MKKHCMMIAAALAVAGAATADAPKGGVMAYAEIETTVLTVKNTATNSVPVKYVSAYELAGYKVTHKVGDVVDMMPMRATWQYGTNRLGIGTNVQLRAAAGTTNRVVAVSVEPVVLVHAQVYDYFGYDPTTANPTAYAAGNAAHTKEFTELDKRLVARYLEAYGLVGGDDRKKLWLDPASPDTDADGLPDGWELYVMFGREGVTETLAAAKISPYNYSDARALDPAGDMTVLEKWNGGAPAYDPWRTDTNGNGVSDVDEIAYRLDDPYGDADGDGLSNVAEWLVGNVFTNFPGTAGISATNAYSLTALMPDYYRRVENLYLGEMFADHDFMEDGWEDRSRATARSLYDPWNDPDGDGWSNYAECRAGTDPGDKASRPAPTIRATVSMAPGEGQLAGKIVLEAYGTEPIDPAGRAEAKWTVETSGVTRAEFRIDGRGVRGGRHVFAAWLDKDGNGKWDPGEPYGAAKDVDVGWSDAEFTVELTQTTPIMARIDIAAAIGGGSGTSSFDTANAATDRGVVNTKLGYWENWAMAHPEACTNMPGNATSLTRVRVVRNWIDGSATRIDGNPSTSYMAVVLDRDFDLSVHPTLTEADLLADGKFDLDWGAISSVAANGMRFESATYRIVVGGDAVGNDDVGELESTVVYKNNLPVQFTNRFEPGTRQTPTVPNPEFAEIVYSSRPTFSWSHTNSINKAYPAFQLRIYADSAKQEIVYDSGVQRAPARDQNGMYEWTAPVYSGMVTDRGKVFTTTNNYYWAVSMLDAKFTGFNPNERVTPFRLSASGNFADGKEHGSILVCVKYFGALVRAPLSAEAVNMTNLVHVQAFTTPDFSGLPVAETYVNNLTNIAADNMSPTNAVIRGVAPGTYYVRAYIDTDYDCKKSEWESWGYNCYVGDNSVREVWAPRPIVLEANLNPPPVATVFMEDVDTDNDGFPDAWEMNENGNLVAQGPVAGNTFFPTVNPSFSSVLNTSGANNSLPPWFIMQ